MKTKSITLFIFIFILVSIFGFYFMAQKPIKVGLLYSQTGTMASSEIPLAKIFKVAIKELNSNGGIKGSHIEILEYDGKSDPKEFAKGAESLIQQGAISLFGCWTSASRKEVKSIVEKYDNLLFYPVQYEGFEASRNIIYLGLSANQQINPTINFIEKHYGNKVYLVGSDYIYPKAANLYIKELAKLTDLKVLGESYIPLGASSFGDIFDDIQNKKPDIIINTLNGESNQAFFKNLEKYPHIPVVSLSIDESMIEIISKNDEKLMQGDYLVAGYFDSMKKLKIKDISPITDAMLAQYIGIQLFKNALEKSDTFTTHNIQKNIKRESFYLDGEIFFLNEKNNHLYKKVYIGKINQNKHLDIVWQTSRIIPPKPYPSFHTKQFWENELEKIYQNYGESWQLQGETHE